jgi:hypothetical protein
MHLSPSILTRTLLIGLLCLAATPGASAAALSVYANALAAGWEDWSWGAATRGFDNGSPVHAGSRSVAVTYTGGWSGLQLGYHGDTLDVTGYDAFRFWVHGGPAGGQTVTVNVVLGEDTLTQAIVPTANAWTQVVISLRGYAARDVRTISWFNNSPGPQPSFYLDDLAFVTANPPAETPAAGPALKVDAQAGRHAISPYIYGINFASEAVAEELKLPVRRWGGNGTTRYNWQLDVHNTGGDWFFENVPEENDHPELLPAGSAADRFVEQDRRTGTRSLLTVPLIGFTPKRRLTGHPFDCGFKVSLYGPQDRVDEWDNDCGNGTLNGVELAGNQASDTSTPIDETFVSDWIGHLRTRFGKASAGGVLFYNLDNEPMLWNSTHRDVHPSPTSYDELRDLTLTYAAAVKAADPGAKTLGPALWGWCAYFYSAADGCGPGPDRQAHGGLDFVPWYLQQLQLYQQAHGKRLLDYLDLHFYPQAQGVYSRFTGDAAVQALRLRSTRALWDARYVDESWIGQPVRLIPRMKQWVAQHYPGTKLAIGEYNWGAPQHINGALAQADVLGIFARQGLHLATLWDPPESMAPLLYAFRLYRNYDGQGGAFGETGVSATSGNRERLAIYAAQRSSDGALTLVLINKTKQRLTSPLALSGFTPATGQAQVYRYSSANLGAIVPQPAQPVTATGTTLVLPAESITLLAIPGA